MIRKIIILSILLWSCHTPPLTIEDKYSMAYQQFTREEYGPALAGLNNIIEEEPEYIKAYLARAAIREIRLEFDAALEDLGKALKLEPGLHLGYFNKANLYIRRKEYSRAIANYTLCLKVAPWYAPAYLNRGITLLKEERKQEALEDFRQYRYLSSKNSKIIDELILKLEREADIQ